MAVDAVKSINGGVGALLFFSDFFASHFPILRNKTTSAFVYTFAFLSVVFTFFLALSPSPDSSYPRLSTVLLNHKPSILSPVYGVFSSPTDEENHILLRINATERPRKSSLFLDENKNVVLKSEDLSFNRTGIVERMQTRKANISDAVLEKTKQSRKGNYTDGDSKKKKKKENEIDELMNCDLFDGNWVRNETYDPLYKPGSCSLIDEQFNCFLNGRPDTDYFKLRWKPRACTLPRLDGHKMLELLRGRRLVFVGDSLNRNMWESLICILKNVVKDEKKVYEQQGRHHFREDASFCFVFQDYDFTVEFFVSPFLVQEWHVFDINGSRKETLRLDLMSKSSARYKDADIIVFNTGHWWTHDKTSTGKDYYQEGDHVYRELNVLEAFRKALTTWGRWVDSNVNRNKSLVFFRGYSASHFSGGQWNSGGQCDNETEPIEKDEYLTPYIDKMIALEQVLGGMKTQVNYLNVTRMTDYRKDGHPSVYRKRSYTDREKESPLSFQDCSHWCLPGVPDAWNEILFAQLLVKMRRPTQF